MKMFARNFALAVLAALLAAPLAAADKNDKNPQNDKDRQADKNRPDKGQLDQGKLDKNKGQPDKNQKAVQLFGQKGDPLAGFNLPKGVELSADQQEKLKAIKAEAAPKLAELQTQLDTILTKERKEAQSAAMQKAKAEGKNKQEVVQAGQQALGLKDDEAAKLKQLALQRGTIVKEVQQQLQALLTEEQKAKLAEFKKGKGPDKNAKPAKGLKPDKGAAPDKGGKPDKGAAPDKGAKPDKGSKPDKGAAPDKGRKPDKGVAPDKGAKPDKGSKPDKGAAPDKGGKPDKGAAPDKGTQPDKNAKPTKGGLPDTGTSK